MAAVAERQEVRAEAKWVRVSARKARLVAEHIRGRSVPEARTVLAFTQRAAAREIEKVLRSAIANAESNPNRHWSGDELYVKAVYVDDGPTLKRWRPRARGRVSRILKRTCHITVKLDQLTAVEAAPRAPKAAAQPKSEAKPKAKRTSKKKEAVAS